jgi:phosphoglycerate dehydrogenase-like enzyme
MAPACPGDPMTVAVYWDDLARRPEQLARIARASGTEPFIWDGTAPAPDVEVLLAVDVPAFIPLQTPRLRLLQYASAGVEWLVGEPIWHSDVPLATAAGAGAVPMSEHVFMLLLALIRGAGRYAEAQRRHEWNDDPPYADELYGRTIGLIGYGHVGHAVAHLARAFGMRVLATSATVGERAPLVVPGVSPFIDPPANPAARSLPDERLPLAQLDELIAASDILVVCAALTPRSRGLVDARALALMKPGSYLINVSRGRIVDEAAMIEALREGRLAGAGLDVTIDEPLPADSPLWDLPAVSLTPHVSTGAVDRYVRRVVSILLANLDCVRRGEPPLTAVDCRRGY